MQAYYDLFQCWVQYRVGFILLLYYNCMIFFYFYFISFFKCIYVDVSLRNLSQYYRKKIYIHTYINIYLFIYLFLMAWLTLFMQNLNVTLISNVLKKHGRKIKHKNWVTNPGEVQVAYRT